MHISRMLGSDDSAHQTFAYTYGSVIVSDILALVLIQPPAQFFRRMSMILEYRHEIEIQQ